MLHRFLPLATAAALTLATPVWAQATRATDALLDQLGLPETVAVMRQEGLDYGEELADEMLPGGGGRSWSEVVARIYDVERMEVTVRRGFASAWEEEDMPLEAIAGFFASAEGQQVIRLEISAREAMIDPGVEEAARDAYRDSLDAGAGDPRLQLIADFIEANDLIDANVVGAMNSSYEFYAGLVDGGAFEMSEEEILGVVWDSEADNRSDTREWLFSYMMLAYRPLEEAALRDYVDLASSAQGRALNRALFAGYDRMYAEISYALGLALARQMTAQEL
ncbi:hypothetical protein MAA5396_00571 [Marinovum algicola]|uniref:DUF2059 domain-containing protein n=1 Tax=Marinovum algicola TaxID=42444 RepID=A0A975W876_9RHOB|nr:DUF2059 domain-containing protein [Marinovum algicola]SEJ04715.1 hypothetical protein SAMN04487940_10358 [Marinovum algicola]SLN18705.1 hypothetical protein MAA5396_00571 [Marinovum algicola]